MMKLNSRLTTSWRLSLIKLLFRVEKISFGLEIMWGFLIWGEGRRWKPSGIQGIREDARLDLEDSRWNDFRHSVEDSDQDGGCTFTKFSLLLTYRTELHVFVKFEVFKVGHWKSNVSFCYRLGLKINVSSDIPTCGCRSVRVNLIRE